MRGSPVLRLEKVAMSPETQRAIEHGLAEAKLSPAAMRRASRRGETARAPESREKRLARKKVRGASVVLPPPAYADADARSYAAVRAPGTLAANVHVMAEIRRLRPRFAPESLLDFGAGIGVSLTAAARVFSVPTPAAEGRSGEDESSETLQEAKEADDCTFGDGPTSLQSALLIDQSRDMRALAKPIVSADPRVSAANVSVQWAPMLREADKSGYDVVVASYSLCEIARAAMAEAPTDEDEVGRENRVKRAEKRLRGLVRTLWARTRPGGMLVVIEDGTSAGFETVLFAREAVRRDGGVRVVAPCLHSLKCPLEGSVDRHRVCRFVQRLNRPLFLRIAKPMHAGFEDEYFSYTVLEKVSEGEDVTQGDEGEDEVWGRLMRAPLLRGKHVVLDACLKDGTLERRTVGKKSAIPGMYNVARKAKWGDVWPVQPEGGAQNVNF